MVHHPAAGVALAIFESSRFEKIRYAKALSVETTWLFCDSDQLDQCMARVYYRCVFDDAVLRVPGWLKAFCDQRTREELRATYGRWVHAAGADEEDERPPLQKEHGLGRYRAEARACWCFGGEAERPSFSVRSRPGASFTRTPTALQARHWTTNRWRRARRTSRNCCGPCGALGPVLGRRAVRDPAERQLRRAEALVAPTGPAPAGSSPRRCPCRQAPRVVRVVVRGALQERIADRDLSEAEYRGRARVDAAILS